MRLWTCPRRTSQVSAYTFRIFLLSSIGRENQCKVNELICLNINHSVVTTTAIANP